jgi:hypothetical protein
MKQFIIFVLLLVLSASLVVGAESSFVYDSGAQNVSLVYDRLDRVVSKTSSMLNMSYVYDGQFFGTLSNVSSNGIVINYEYDDKFRVIKETKVVDGIGFEKSYVYDSGDRLISTEVLGYDVDYFLDRRGVVRSIPGFVDDSTFNAFGSIMNLTYANGLITSHAYDAANNRLTNIAIPNIQNLTYTYDSVGNILTINDAVQNKMHVMTYDDLDRLRTTTIGSDRYVYSFNPTGNIMKIVKNSESKKFVYQGRQAHAPSKIIEGDAGIDVYGPTEIDTGSKTRAYEFFLLNDKETAASGVNVSASFGDGNKFDAGNLTVNFSVWFFVENGYAHGGNYDFNVSAASAGMEDYEKISTKFGTRAEELETIFNNASERTFEFKMQNDVSETVFNVSWNCTDSINSLYATNLSGGQFFYDYISRNYSSPGLKTFTCTAVSNDGTESKTTTFTIKGLEIENYDILTSNVTSRVVSYNVKNHFTASSVNIGMQSEGIEFSKTTSLSLGEGLMIFAEANYSSDGAKTFTINASTAGQFDSHTDSFKKEGVSVENYVRVLKNETTNILLFDVRNNWLDGIVYWNVSDPSLINSTNLRNNETVLVVIENNYTQGSKQTEVNARVSEFVAQITDIFSVKPLEIESLSTLSEGQNAVSEIVVKNNLNSPQYFTWTYNSGQQNLSLSLTNITEDNLFVFIETNYSSEGVFKTLAIVNSSTYYDNRTGVVVS